MFTFYQRSGEYYDAEFDFKDFARENLFPDDNDVAENFLTDMMRQAMLAPDIIKALPSFLPRDIVTHHGTELKVPNHFAAWCYRLGSKLKGGKVTSDFWRLVLELPAVHGSDIQPRAELALGRSLQSMGTMQTEFPNVKLGAYKVSEPIVAVVCLYIAGGISPRDSAGIHHLEPDEEIGELIAEQYADFIELLRDYPMDFRQPRTRLETMYRLWLHYHSGCEKDRERLQIALDDMKISFDHPACPVALRARARQKGYIVNI